MKLTSSPALILMALLAGLPGSPAEPGQPRAARPSTLQGHSNEGTFTDVSGEIPSARSGQRSAGAAAEDRERAERMAGLIERLRPQAVRLAEPGPWDWLADHPEKGQTFEEYLAGDPIRPTADRGAIYIQPLGAFTATQRRLIELTAEAMAAWFNVPVEFCDGLGLDVIPAAARRADPHSGREQLLTGHILGRLLKPRLPRAAAAYLCFTATDLWPGQGWNFVFGHASLEERVGVWSIARFGDPDRSPADFRLALLRTLKLATHECGHMFSVPHCTAYECNMNGCNSLDESDRHPLALCPVCLAKICWATRAEPAGRCRKLIEFCRRQGLTPEAEIYEKRLAAIVGMDHDRSQFSGNSSILAGSLGPQSPQGPDITITPRRPHGR